MLELKVSEIEETKPIIFNFEEIKSELTERLEVYKTTVYQEEDLKKAKEDRAKLNKLAKAISDKRIEVKKSFNKPISDFETKTKELEKLIKEAVIVIDDQVKLFEENQKNAKLQEIVEFFNKNIGEYQNLINFDYIFNKRWLNATYSIKNIEDDIQHIIAKTNDDLMVLDGQFKDENINKQIKDYYFRNVAEPSVLSLAIREGVRIVENNKRLEELEQKKKEELQTIQDNNNNTQKIQENNIFEKSTDEIVELVSKQTDLQQIDFRVWVTQEQKFNLREYLIKNNIKYGKVK